MQGGSKLHREAMGIRKKGEVDDMKNCFSCRYREIYEKETPESFLEEGFYCENRAYISKAAENLHLRQMQLESYQSRPKRCWAKEQKDV